MQNSAINSNMQRSTNIKSLKSLQKFPPGYLHLQKDERLQGM